MSLGIKRNINPDKKVPIVKPCTNPPAVRLNLKRNIRKSGNNIDEKPTPAVNQVSSATNVIVLKRNGLGKYKFPLEPNVPEGVYISKIAHVQQSVTNKGTPAIEVYYDFKPLNQCKREVNGWAKPTDKKITHHIKQKYPKGTEYYDEFIDAMSEALETDDEFELEAIKGVDEVVFLKYKTDGGLGNIDQRKPFDNLDFLIEEDNYQETEDVYEE